MNRRIIVGVVAAFYYVGLVLTTGHSFVRFEKQCAENHYGRCDPEAVALFVGVFWPLYVPVKLSIDAFR